MFRLDSTGPTELVTGLHGNWYNDPQVWYDEVTDDVYTVRGTDLVRIHLAALS